MLKIAFITIETIMMCIFYYESMLSSAYNIFLSRFHPACIDMIVEEAKRLDHFYCETCSAEDQNKLQNSHSVTRNSDMKVFIHYCCLING